MRELRSLQRLPASTIVDASLMPDGAMLVRLGEIAGGPPPEGLARRRDVLVRASVDPSTWDTVGVFRDTEEMRIVRGPGARQRHDGLFAAAGELPNSRSLSVTRESPRLRARAAISRSLAPIGSPLRSRSARTRP
jgi:hypothetical protein